MIDKGGGLFALDSNDWGNVITWPSHHYCGVEPWEEPIFCAEIAQWFSQRNVPPDAIKIGVKHEYRSIEIRDENLYIEFKLRWCRFYPETYSNGHAWTFCEQKYQAEKPS